PRVKRTPSTETRLDALRAIVRQVRDERLAIVEEEFVLGGTGIAAPIFAPDGTILATLDVGCITTRFQAKRADVLKALAQSAQALSQSLAMQEGE
ncbi:MAG: IclR family transcriptional regulator domain-containing protein, partial [Phreatobacter sp.]